MIINGEGSLGAQENGDISVVSCRNSFTVKCFLHHIWNISLRGSRLYSCLIFFSLLTFHVSVSWSRVETVREHIFLSMVLLSVIEWTLAQSIGQKLAINVTVIVLCFNHQLLFSVFVVAFQFTILFALISRYFHTWECMTFATSWNTSMGRDTSNVIQHVFFGVATGFAFCYFINDLVWHTSYLISIRFGATMFSSWSGSTDILLNLVSQKSI